MSASPVHSPPVSLALSCAAVAALHGLVSIAGAAEESNRFFEQKIRPVLVTHCYECHSVESGKAKGGLRVDSREALREGGESGPALVAGNPAESLLLLAIRHEEPDLEMPPKKAKLDDGIADDFEKWIRDGAFDPREEETPGDSSDQPDLDSPLDHWSYRPILRPPVPATGSNWPRHPVDHFVLRKLEENHLSPSPDANPAVFARRLYLDLTGLPPTPEQVDLFSFSRLEEIVDELLASPDFGVRWARHWLDVVRFAESNGRESNIVYPHAWRYRDYVIESIDNDTPYDRFLLEQIAGDLLPFETEAERARNLIATGFLAVGAKGLNSQDKAQFAADLVDEQLDALSRGLLASSLACARCHDHKSDPVTIEDYHSLIGIFRSSKTYYGTWVDSENNNPGELLTLPDLPGQLKPGKSIPPQKLREMHEQLAKLDEEERQRKEQTEKAREEGIDLRESFNEMLRDALRIYWTRGGIEGRLATVDEEGNPLPLCMGVTEADVMHDSPVYLRGELKHPTEPVPRGVPALFGMDPAPPTTGEHSGRLSLAHWMARPEHPLTARVLANRVWSHLVGSGLVSTPDDFGHNGARPTHPELLDWLAVSLRENGWSLKNLVREIVLSRTYRQASDHRAKAFRKDPDNALLWRIAPRRLDAEAIRDSMLAISGELDRSPRPASLAAELRSHSVSLVGFDPAVPGDLDGSLRRSIYLPVFRENLPDVLELFDFAEPSLVVGERDETNVPLQSLYLINSPFVQERAAALAERLLREAPDRSERIHRAFRLCFLRSPDAEEIEISREFFVSAAGEETDEKERTARFCQALLTSAEFRIAD